MRWLYVTVTYSRTIRSCGYAHTRISVSIQAYTYALHTRFGVRMQLPVVWQRLCLERKPLWNGTIQHLRPPQVFPQTIFTKFYFVRLFRCRPLPLISLGVSLYVCLSCIPYAVYTTKIVTQKYRRVLRIFFVVCDGDSDSDSDRGKKPK